jgi:acyl-phosphate glycerol 3-phosphate acyltransferase
MSPLFWLIFSYLLGSIPFGYLISKACGKDILKIGWRKTSGSNVFKNVGKWQGVLTGILDLTKGYLAVFGAQRLGFSPEVQIFSGVAAVTGHNWSLYLKFAGGRGIGTFIGASLALAPKILGISLIPFFLLSLIWNAAIGTLLFLATAIFVSIYLNQFEIAGIFTTISLVPILIKRLSPIKEIKKAQNRTILVRNRLLFDNDELCLDLRIKRIIKKTLDYQANKISKNVLLLIKILTAPIILPPKLTWMAAKFGVKAAQKPIKKLISKPPEKVVTEIKIEDLKRMMLAASKKIVFHQDEINKINVWPVADKDTGYNLAATLLGIEGAISQKEYGSIFELTQAIKEGAMINARGNAGMIYTGYLIRVCDEIRNLRSIDSLQLASAMKKGIKAAYRAILNPVEGTILDVIKTSGEKAYEIAKLRKEKNIIKILEEALKFSKTALKETKEKLEALKKADVVDAGALGFVKILEAWTESLKGAIPALDLETKLVISEPKIEEEIKERYEVVSQFKKEKNFILKELKNELSLLGSSLEILELEDKIKLHIHTNFPEKIREKIKKFEILEWRLEDFLQQKKKITKKPLGLIVDQTANLPKEFLEKHQIEVVPFLINFPESEKIPGQTLYEKMRKAKKLPTTSAPNFKDYLSCYKRALEKFEKILVLTLPAKLSGAYSQARIAKSIFKKPEKLRITVFDCLNAETAEGLVAIRAQELISQGKKLEEILEDLKKFCPKVRLFGCVGDLKYVVHGGRVKIPKILIPLLSLFQKLGLQILLGLKEGKAKFLGIRVGKDLAKILAKEIDRLRGGKEIRVAIAHADNKKAAENLKKELERMPGIKILFISSVSPVVGVHAGPGTLLVAFSPV